MKPTNEGVCASSYRPTAEDLRRTLPDIGDGLQAQLQELYARPDPDRAECLARNLDGARLAVLRFRERLIAEGEGHAQ